MDKKRAKKEQTETAEDGSERTSNAQKPTIFIINENLKREFIQQAARNSAARRNTVY